MVVNENKSQTDVIKFDNIFIYIIKTATFHNILNIATRLLQV